MLHYSDLTYFKGNCQVIQIKFYPEPAWYTNDWSFIMESKIVYVFLVEWDGYAHAYLASGINPKHKSLSIT